MAIIYDYLQAVQTANIADGAITDAKVAASGITTRTKLPAQIMYDDEANTVSQPITITSNGIGGITFQTDGDKGIVGKTSGGINRYWVIYDETNDLLILRNHVNNGTIKLRKSNNDDIATIADTGIAVNGLPLSGVSSYSKTNANGYLVVTETSNYGVYYDGGTNTIQLVTAGNPAVLADNDVADGETALLVRRNVGGSLTLQRVSMGAADSGGAGYKVLRVLN
ncbi:MAG: hypothetical protein AB1753_04160 [Thermoproteota archaeon]